jgi:hypothetical protein
MPVGIAIGRGLLLINLANRIRRRKAAGVRRVRLCLAGLNRGRGLRGDSVEMPERKHKLDSQRKKRQPRAMFDVRSEPLHADTRLALDSRDTRLPQRYNITSQGLLEPVNSSPSACSEISLNVCDSRNSAKSLKKITVLRGRRTKNKPIRPAKNSSGAVRNAVGIRCGAFSGNMKVSFQAARSIG